MSARKHQNLSGNILEFQAMAKINHYNIEKANLLENQLSLYRIIIDKSRES